MSSPSSAGSDLAVSLRDLETKLSKLATMGPVSHYGDGEREGYRTAAHAIRELLEVHP